MFFIEVFVHLPYAAVTLLKDFIVMRAQEAKAET